MFAALHRIERKLDALLERKDPMPAIDDLKTDLGAFFTAFDAFTANVQSVLADARAATSNDPAIVALDEAVHEEMAKLAASAAALNPAPAAVAPAAPAA